MNLSNISTPKLKPSFRNSRTRNSGAGKNPSGAYRSPLLSASIDLKNKESVEQNLETTPLAKRPCYEATPDPPKPSLVRALLSPEVNKSSGSPIGLRAFKDKYQARNRFSSSFKSPMLRGSHSKSTEDNNLSVEDLDGVHSKEDFKAIAKTLRLKEQELNNELRDLEQQDYKLEELDWYIDKLHEYNDIKDIAQMLMGRIAVIEETTIKHIHEQFGLNEDD